MLAYHNDQSIKAKYLARVKRHRAADGLIQGQGWKDGKGCAVGCTLEAYDHSRYPIELGVPLRLAYLEDRLFELSTRADAQKWPEQFLDAIPVGADLSRVWPQWAEWMLVDPDHGVVRCARTEEARAAIARVAELYRDGGSPDEFAAARSAAYAAAYAAAAPYAASAASYASAAVYAAASAAASAADDAADDADDAASAASAAAVASAADDAAVYAAASAAASAARAAWVVAARKKLLELLRAAPTPMTEAT